MAFTFEEQSPRREEVVGPDDVQFVNASGFDQFCHAVGRLVRRGEKFVANTEQAAVLEGNQVFRRVEAEVKKVEKAVTTRTVSAEGVETDGAPAVETR
jgi:hypothetical protein